jgi:hypothetical protein
MTQSSREGVTLEVILKWSPRHPNSTVNAKAGEGKPGFALTVLQPMCLVTNKKIKPNLGRCLDLAKQLLIAADAYLRHSAPLAHQYT